MLNDQGTKTVTDYHATRDSILRMDIVLQAVGRYTAATNGECVSTSDNGSCTSPCATCSKTLTWCLSCDQTSTTPVVNPVDGSCVSSDYEAPATLAITLTLLLIHVRNVQQDVKIVKTQ